VEGVAPSVFITALEIIVWLTALAVGLIALLLYAKRSEAKLPMALSIASVLVLLPVTFLFPPLWLRVALDLGLLSGLAWITRQPIEAAQLEPSMKPVSQQDSVK
jgi:hypothetical protein